MAYTPLYILTETLKNNLSKINEIKNALVSCAVPEALDARLRAQALTTNTWSCFRIEGGTLGIDKIQSFGENRATPAGTPGEKDAVNFINMLEAIPARSKFETLTLENLIAMNRDMLTDNIPDAPVQQKLRARQVFVGREVIANGKSLTFVQYMPPPADDVPEMLGEFLGWLNSPDAPAADPVLQAGIVNFEIARIHPFNAGNGRSARFLALLYLCRAGFDTRSYFYLKDSRHADPVVFYWMVKEGHLKGGEMTQWLEYFSDDVLRAAAGDAFSGRRLRTQAERWVVVVVAAEGLCCRGGCWSVDCHP